MSYGYSAKKRGRAEGKKGEEEEAGLAAAHEVRAGEEVTVPRFTHFHSLPVQLPPFRCGVQSPRASQGTSDLQRHSGKGV